MSCGKDKAHLSCWQECPICPLRNCLFFPDIRYYLPLNYTATPHTLAKRYKVCRHTDTLGWWQHVAISQSWQYAEAPTRENCLSVPQAIKAEALMTCIPVSQHTRFMPVQQTCKRFTAHPVPVSPIFLTSLYIIHHSSCRQYQWSSSNQRSGRHISCKVSRLWDNRQILLEVLWLWTIFLFLGKEYSSHIICLYVFSCGLWEQKISLHRQKGLERREEKETVKRTQREFIHYAERKFLQRS